MTGTAETEAAEFASTYELPVVPIPTNMPMIREDEADLIYKTEEAKFDAVVDDIVGALRAGQPVLVGHRLGREVRAALAPAREDGASPTRSSTPSSTSGRPRSSPRPAGSARSPSPPTWPAVASTSSSAATPRAWPDREALARGVDLDRRGGSGDARGAAQAEFETAASEEGDEVRELGGLYVLGSERHESRRIDNQLRGRSGRQGDPGESRFFLSLEDDLMRLFATGAMNWVMGRALPDDVPIEAKMVTKAIERAQNTVEGRNAEIRKDVLKYDEVMNEQRKVIYRPPRPDHRRRGPPRADRRAARGDDDEVVASSCPTDYPEEWDLERLLAEVTQYYPTKFAAEDLAEAATAAARSPRASSPRRSSSTRSGTRPSPAGRRWPARSSARSCSRSSTSGGGTTWPRWTTSARASTCGRWASRTRSWRGSARASRCSAS